MNFIMLALSLCVLTGLFLWNRFLQVELLCQKKYAYYYVDTYCQIALQNDHTSDTPIDTIHIVSSYTHQYSLLLYFSFC